MATIPNSALATRLNPETLVELRLVSELIGEKGHAVIWAINYEKEYGELPTPAQIIIGLCSDLNLTVSPSSAARALRDIRSDTRRHVRLAA